MKRIDNPPNPFASYDCEYFGGAVPPARLEVYEDATRQILSRNDSPDIGFRWSVNPYRGCVHACAYCYARPTHEYLGFGAGTDFETRIVVKMNAAKLLRESFLKESWKGERIVFSGDTDCYQPLEAGYELTRLLLEVCLEFGNPAGIITKSFLILRDLDLLKKIHERTRLWVSISIPFADETTARQIEPHASAISKRFEAVQRLSEAGISTGVLIAPIIPGLNDSDIPILLKKAAECGAQFASPVLLRLPGNVKDVFLSKIKTLFPLAYKKIIGRIRQVRKGELYQSEFGKRFQGEGPYWENIQKVFRIYCDKWGLNRQTQELPRDPFRRPSLQEEFAFSRD